MYAPRIRFPFRVAETIGSAWSLFRDSSDSSEDELEDDMTREQMLSRILDLALRKRRGQSRRKKGYNLRKDILQTRLIRFLSGDIKKILMIREKRRSRAEGYLKGL
ncbi:hypothetical protein TELCIR_05764 [Teladorsagia circumcincta]|uniref:Uncharacterized protein n=1 Tax=Teladorsagia circumcincta TaxID=45464 RepID=A0A2G9UQ03_TELCI|nr:hypothetical protein TELCIR_05764 [Teladorsagia circumcincta]